MNIVLDTNIVFSVIAKTKGVISNVFFSRPVSTYYKTPDFLITELQTHSAKLKRISGLSSGEYEIAKTSVFSQIDFIDTGLIPDRYMKQAVQLTADIDFKDFKFVALSLFLNSLFWTGDRPLYIGLRRKGFANVVNTKEIAAIFNGLYQ